MSSFKKLLGRSKSSRPDSDADRNHQNFSNNYAAQTYPSSLSPPAYRTSEAPNPYQSRTPNPYASFTPATTTSTPNPYASMNNIYEEPKRRPSPTPTVDHNREALFGDRRPARPISLAPSYRTEDPNYDPSIMETEAERKLRYGEGFENEDDEVNAIKGQIRNVNAETERLTINSVALANKALESGVRTIGMLDEQSATLFSVGKTLNDTQKNTILADQNLKELKVANRPLFQPHFNNPLSRGPQKRERALNTLAQNSIVLDQEAVNSKRYVNDVIGQAMNMNVQGRRPPTSEAEARYREEKERQWREHTAKKAYMFEAEDQDFERERVIEDGLEEVSAASGKLNLVAKAINTQLDEQNRRLAAMADQTDQVNTTLYMQTSTMKGYHK